MSRLYFCRCTIRLSWEITFSDRATIYQLNGACSSLHAHQLVPSGIDRSSFEDSLRCRARERGSDNIAGLFMDRWAATVLRHHRSPIALRPARRCVHYWIDVICSRWNCPSWNKQNKKITVPDVRLSCAPCESLMRENSQKRKNVSTAKKTWRWLVD